MKKFIFFLFAVISSTFLSAQEEVPNTNTSHTKLTSENVTVWDRKNSLCTVQLNTMVNKIDTIHTLCFIIKDRKGVGNIAIGEQLAVKFEDGKEIVLNCNKNYDLTKEKQSFLFLYGFIPFGYSFQYEQVCPQYEISQDALLNIVGGKVTSLTFFMEGETYNVHTKSNRFALAVGETCASLKSDRKDKSLPKITSKTIFGDTKLRHNIFGWNNTTSLAFGMGHMYSRFGGNDFSRRMPINMVLLDTTLKGLYLGCGVGSHTEDDYLQQIFVFKAGPAFRYGNICSRMVFTPYIGVLGGESKIKGYRSKVLESNTYFIAGIRTAYEYKHFQIAANFSNKECGVVLGVAF